jgi:hypothetical protein
MPGYTDKSRQYLRLAVENYKRAGAAQSKPLDMISVPRGENRSFRNVSSELGRLLVMIVPETDEQVDPIRV